MKSKLIFFCLLSIFCGKISADDNVPELFDYELRGNITAFSEAVYTANRDTSEKIYKNKLITASNYFVANKNEVYKQQVEDRASITYYTYNEKFLIKEIHSIRIKDRSSISKSEYYYDEYSRPYLELNYGSSGKLRDSIVVIVDNTQLNVEKKAFNARGHFLYRISIRYNEFGKIDKKIRTTIESSIRYIYTFDKNGRLIEEKWYLNDTVVQKICFEYNAAGKIIKKVEYDDNDIAYATTEYEYNPLTGFLLQIKANDHITKYDYNYDSVGNWIVRYEYYDNIPTQITERTITYTSHK